MNSSIPSRLSTLLFELRRSKGWTQWDLSEKSSVPPRSIQRIEAGRTKRPTFYTLQNLAKALEIDVTELQKAIRDEKASETIQDEIDRDIFLHLYVPNGRYQEEQLAGFLRLVESYLQRVEHLQFFIEIRKTLHGKIYEFKSKTTPMNLTDLEVAISRFDQFMGFCQYDQKKAEVILLKAGMNVPETSRLLTKYMKEYQRLLLDIEHERESKILSLRHGLESEALEVASGGDLSLTKTIQPSTLFSLPNNSEPIGGITISNSSVIINPGLQSYIEQAIYGDIHYTTEDKELLDLFMKYSQGLEAVRLRSDLEQLKDTSSQEPERRTAKQKIVTFLAKVAPAIGQSALTILTAYVEKILIGS